MLIAGLWLVDWAIGMINKQTMSRASYDIFDKGSEERISIVDDLGNAGPPRVRPHRLLIGSLIILLGIGTVFILVHCTSLYRPVTVTMQVPSYHPWVITIYSLLFGLLFILLLPRVESQSYDNLASKGIGYGCLENILLGFIRAFNIFLLVAATYQSQTAVQVTLLFFLALNKIVLSFIGQIYGVKFSESFTRVTKIFMFSWALYIHADLFQIMTRSSTRVETDTRNILLRIYRLYAN